MRVVINLINMRMVPNLTSEQEAGKYLELEIVGITI
jgi:hypothetical protein